MKPARQPPHPRDKLLKEVESRAIRKLRAELNERFCDYYLGAIFPTSRLSCYELKDLMRGGDINEEIAAKLSEDLGISKKFWMNSQKSFDDWSRE